jgi:hypothetical protein
MTNHEFILNLLKDGAKHCSNELPFRDERKRISELRAGKNRWHKKFDIGGEPCLGRCGRTHDNPDLHWLWLVNPGQIKEIDLLNEERPVQEEKPRINDFRAPEPKPLPPICCSLARAGTGFHTRGCDAQK